MLTRPHITRKGVTQGSAGASRTARMLEPARSEIHPSVEAASLVGYLKMRFTIFEPLREWTLIVRRSKGSKNPAQCSYCVGAKELWQGDGPARAVRRDINASLEPTEFMTEQRYLRTTWLNIKQLLEPQASPVEFIFTSPIISHA